MKKFSVEAVKKFFKDGEEFTNRTYYGENGEQIYSVSGYGEADCDVENEIARQDITAEKGFVNQDDATNFANELLAKPEMKGFSEKLVSVKVL